MFVKNSSASKWKNGIESKFEYIYICINDVFLHKTMWFFCIKYEYSRMSFKKNSHPFGYLRY
jgi:hypothetical protein